MAVRHETQDNIDNDPAKVGTRYSVRNPHPGFGNDPNIINEYGHTQYPKWISHPFEKEVHVTTTYLSNKESRTNRIETDIPLQVLVESADKEAELRDRWKRQAEEKGIVIDDVLDEAPIEKKQKSRGGGWNK